MKSMCEKQMIVGSTKAQADDILAKGPRLFQISLQTNFEITVRIMYLC